MTYPAFSVSYDYLCPFAKNFHLHLVKALRDGAEFDVSFVPWSLHQVHREEGALDVWLDPEKDDALSALCASISVRDNQAERFLDAHDALFRARHEKGIRLKDLDEVLGVMEGVGVDTDLVAKDVASRRPFEVLGESHHAMAKVEHFGVPTVVIGDTGVFVRFMEPTKPEIDSRAVVTQVLDLMTGSPLLNEYKHTRVSR